MSAPISRDAFSTDLVGEMQMSCIRLSRKGWFQPIGISGHLALTILVAVAPHLKAQGDTSIQPTQSAASKQTVTLGTQNDLALTPEQQGDLYMARRRYEAAIQAYRLVSPTPPLVWNKMGMANQQMFNMAEAKKDYEASLKLDPKNPDVLNNLATVYYAFKQYAIAEHLYRKALKAEPGSALVYKNLGTDLLAEDKFKKGWDCYQAALKLDPEIFERVNQFRIGEPTATQKRGAMNFFLAKSYARVGMNDRAIGYLRMAIDEGFTDRKKIIADTEFASLRGNLAFEQLLAEQRAQ